MASSEFDGLWPDMALFAENKVQKTFHHLVATLQQGMTTS